MKTNGSNVISSPEEHGGCCWPRAQPIHILSEVVNASRHAGQQCPGLVFNEPKMLIHSDLVPFLPIVTPHGPRAQT
jgi:hypothetical protein